MHRGPAVAAAARPPFSAGWHGSRAELSRHARGFAAGPGGDEPPGPADSGSESEWLDSDSSDSDDSSEEEDDDSSDDEEGAVKQKHTTISEAELARMEIEDPLACACRRASAAPRARSELLWRAAADAPARPSPLALADAFAVSMDPNSRLGLPPLEQLLAGDDEEAEERAARRSSEEAMQKEIADSRVRKVDSQGRAYATGKRKAAIARVWLMPGSGLVTVNGRLLDAYFPDIMWRTHVVYPFVVTETLSMFDATVFVQGGGPSGQAQAVRQGVAKALQAWEPAMRPALRDHGLITRDSRVVERKKPGRAKARKSFQWVKR